MYTNTHLQKHADTWKNKNTYEKKKQRNKKPLKTNTHTLDKKKQNKKTNKQN